jgi:hypothetical protein
LFIQGYSNIFAQDYSGLRLAPEDAGLGGGGMSSRSIRADSPSSDRKMSCFSQMVQSSARDFKLDNNATLGLSQGNDFKSVSNRRNSVLHPRRPSMTPTLDVRDGSLRNSLFAASSSKGRTGDARLTPPRLGSSSKERRSSAYAIKVEEPNQVFRRGSRIISVMAHVTKDMGAKPSGRELTGNNQGTIAQMIDLRIQAICMFTLSQFLLGMIDKSRQKIFIETLSTICENFIQEFNMEREQFGCGYMIILEEALTANVGRIQGYNFDITNGSWIPWKDMKNMDYPDISFELGRENFSKDELARFNSKSLALKAPVAFNDKKIVQMNDLEEPQIVQIPQTKRANYLMDYFIAYKKNILLCGDYQSGKSMLIKNKMRKLHETQKHHTINFELTANSSLKIISGLIEKNLLKQGGCKIGPPSDKHAVIILEDLNFGPIKIPPSSLARNHQ